MTKPLELRRCAWCGQIIPGQGGPGRPRRFCRRSHRQRHYEARRLAAAQGIAADEVLLGRQQYDQWREIRALLEAAIEDAEQDLGDAPTLREYTEAFQVLHEAAVRMQAFRLETAGAGVGIGGRPGEGELPNHGPTGARPQRLYPPTGPFEFGAEDGQAGNDDDGAGSRYEQENDTDEDDDQT